MNHDHPTYPTSTTFERSGPSTRAAGRTSSRPGVWRTHIGRVAWHESSSIGRPASTTRGRGSSGRPPRDPDASQRSPGPCPGRPLRTRAPDHDVVGRTTVRSGGRHPTHRLHDPPTVTISSRSHSSSELGTVEGDRGESVRNGSVDSPMQGTEAFRPTNNACESHGGSGTPVRRQRRDGGWRR